TTPTKQPMERLSFGSLRSHDYSLSPLSDRKTAYTTFFETRWPNTNRVLMGLVWGVADEGGWDWLQAAEVVWGKCCEGWKGWMGCVEVRKGVRACLRVDGAGKITIVEWADW